MSAPANAAAPLRLLLIEDSGEDAALLMAQLRRAGLRFEPEVVETAEQLSQKMEAQYDVVLSDYRLRGWRGLDAFHMLQRRPEPAPFILVTGTVGEDVAVECLKEGIADFVLKDRPERLPHAIERAIAEAAARRKRLAAEAALRQAQEELEARVMERTSELNASNEALRREIAERQQMERALRESEQRFRLLIEAIPDMVWTAAPSGYVNYCNQRWLDYTGLAMQQTEGWGWWKAVHCEDTRAVEEQWKESLRRGVAFEAEYRLRRASDGEYRWHLGRGVPLRDAAGGVIQWFGTCTDIHDRKLARQVQVQLDIMRDELVSHVSHALRTPLASLRGFSELLLTREFTQEKRREFLTLIQQESNRLTQLINEFLDLQRMESGRQSFHFESVDVGALMRERATFFASADALHPVRLELPALLPGVIADVERLRDVLNNLLSNAFKYSPSGGEVVLGARAEGGEVVLWVADRGIGIPADAMPHLFSKFFRVEQRSGIPIAGTGLGLATVRQIVELHHGRAWAESVYGEGSTFFVALPCERTPAPLAIVEKEPTDGEDAQILLVEDDPTFARLLCERLQEAGWSVRATAYAEQALEWCRRNPPQLALLDLHLAGAMDGWDLLLTLKNHPRLQAVPVIVMAGSDPNTHGLALSGAEYALKSSTSEELERAVRRQMPSPAGKLVMIADDDPVFRRRMRYILQSRNAKIEEAMNGAQALEQMEKQMPELLVLDLIMPELDGFEVLRRLRNDRRAVNLRTLVVTMKDLTVAEKAYLTRKMASLVGKGAAELDFFVEEVARALNSQPELSASLAH